MEKYRAWWVINPPNNPIYTPCNNPDEGRKIIQDEIARQSKEDWIWGNAFGFEVFEDGEWGEWYDENGFDIEWVSAE
jgi:hypothetical protein